MWGVKEGFGMKNDFEGISFSIAYEVAVVRPLRQTTLREREAALRKAYYNTELIPLFEPVES